MGGLWTQEALSQKVLGSSATGWSHTGDLNETALASVTIPPNTIGAFGQIEVYTLWSMPNNANTKTVAIRYGAANDLTGTLIYQDARTTSGSEQTYHIGRGKNSTGLQMWTANNVTGGIGSASIDVIGTSVNTTATSYIVFTATCGVNTDTITLESYAVLFVPGA